MLASYGVLAVVTVLLVLPSAHPVEESICDPSTTLSPNSSFQANLNLLAAALPANASSAPTGFATLSAGTANRAHAMALCRGDANASSCAACVAAAFRSAGEKCPNNMVVTMYDDDCLLRFANRQFLDFVKPQQWQVGELSIGTRSAGRSVPSVAAAWFSAAATSILTAVSGRALANSTTAADAMKYFATGELDFEPRIYVLAQCVPVLTPSQCSGCLGQLLVQIKIQLSTKPLWVTSRVEWCDLRYSVRPFYKGQAMLQLQAPPSPAPAEKKKTSVARISAGIVCSLVLISIVSVFVFCRIRRRTKAAATEHHNPFKKISRAQCVIFDLPALEEATENFSPTNKLGEGGFGAVYKGILQDGQEIAVKKLKDGDGLDQLQNEVLLLAELQHKNLVRLHGFYSHRDDTLLVYEYIKNGTLDNFLSDTREGHTLIWEQQYNIILGIAKGILYLHEDSSMRIIHRDLKPSNILLDEDMEPRIADFGLARLLGEGHTHIEISKAAGTLGYMAPEYMSHRRVSPKIDIFSYGVLILQIVTRRRECQSNEHVNLLSEVWNHWREGTISQMMDQTLNEHTRNQQLRCIHVGLLCVQEDPGDRPEISTVISMLIRDDMQLQPPKKLAFFFGSFSGRRAPTNSVNGVTITEPYARA